METKRISVLGLLIIVALTLTSWKGRAGQFQSSLNSGGEEFRLGGGASWVRTGGVSKSGGIQLSPLAENSFGTAEIRDFPPDGRVLSFNASFALRMDLSSSPASDDEGFAFYFGPRIPKSPEGAGASPGLSIVFRTFEDSTCHDGPSLEIHFNDEGGNHHREVVPVSRAILDTGTTFGTLDILVTPEGRLFLTWKRGVRDPITLVSKLNCYLPTQGQFIFIAATQTQPSRFAIDNVSISTDPGRHSYVSVRQPIGPRIGSDAGIEVHIAPNGRSVAPATIRLLVDGEQVLNGASDQSSIHWIQPGLGAAPYWEVTYDHPKYDEPDYRPWAPGSSHDVTLRYRENGDLNDHEVRWSFSVDPITPEVYVIETEDFDFGAGETLPEAGINSYPGGGFAGQGGLQGIDLRITGGAHSEYDRLTDPPAEIHHFPCDGDRGEKGSSWSPGDRRHWRFNSDDFVTVLSTPGDWLNYTRKLPSNSALGRWNVYLRAAGTGKSAVLQLDEVISGRGTDHQELRTIGRCTVPADPPESGLQYLSFLDGQGKPVTRELSGSHTFRLTLVEGRCSANYLVFSTPRRESTNRDVPVGYSLHATPYSLGDNTLNELLVGLPEGTSFFKFDASQGRFLASTYTHDRKWLPNLTAPPGTGFFLYSPRATQLRFEGHPVLGAAQVPIPRGYSLLGSPQPLSGPLERALHFPVSDRLQVSKLFPGTQSYDVTDYIEGAGWLTGEPTIGVGEGFWVNQSSPTVWIQPPLEGPKLIPPVGNPQPSAGFGQALQSTEISQIYFCNNVRKDPKDPWIQVGPPLVRSGLSGLSHFADLWFGPDSDHLIHLSSNQPNKYLPYAIEDRGWILLPDDGMVNIKSPPGTEVTLQIRVWPTKFQEFSAAESDPTSTIFISNPFPVRLTSAPNAPATMAGLTNFLVRPALLKASAPTEGTYGDAPLEIPLASPLDPKIEVRISGPAEITSGRHVRFTGAGSVVVEVARAGDGVTFLPAVHQFTISVARAPDSIPNLGLPAVINVGSPVALKVTTSTSGRPITYSVPGDPDAITDGKTLTLHHVGASAIIAEVAEDDRYIGARITVPIGAVQPRFSGTARFNNGTGQFQLPFELAPGTTVEIQWSPDLKTWNHLSTLTSEGPVVLVADPQAVDLHRYYRGVIQ